MMQKSEAIIYLCDEILKIVPERTPFQFQDACVVVYNKFPHSTDEEDKEWHLLGLIYQDTEYFMANKGYINKLHNSRVELTDDGRNAKKLSGHINYQNYSEGLENLTYQKLIGDVEKLTNELGDYLTTKSRAKNSYIISIIAISLSTLTLMRLLMCNTPH